ncbi:MAG: adenylate/guanylate cyclase domain-containing protein [Chitinispirillaceae bacterium]|nr:adenylate/guanylate cyclase domain-containing protein [Chitinispirillaceae bacterium]
MEILKKLFKSLLIGSLVGLGIALFTRFFFQEVIDRLEYVTYYMRYRWEYADLSKEKSKQLEEKGYGIHLIDIDERSMQKMGQYHNWNRSYQAELITQLSRHFPAAIVFDILFGTEEDRIQRSRLDALLMRSRQIDPDITLSDRLREAIISTIDYDEEFVRATREAGCVFHGICLSDESDYRDFALSQVKHKMTMAWHDSLNPLSAVTFAPELTDKIMNRKTILDGIFPALARAARAIGHVDIVPSEDGVIREIPLFYRFGDHQPVYLPISVRTVTSLFATPNDEIRFVPGRYVDIGTPFKAFKDKNGVLSYSYPNVTSAQVRAIVNAADRISGCAPGNQVEVTSLLAASRDENGGVTLDMNIPGFIPCEVAGVLLSADLDKAIALSEGEELTLAPDIVIRRDSETDWVVTAPYDVEEWYFSALDLKTISMLEASDFAGLRVGKRNLIFHQFAVRNIDKELVSSLPCLRNETLRQLCGAGWKTIRDLKPGTRMDFGEHVRIPLNRHNYHIITFFGPKAKPFPVYSFYDIYKNRVQGFLEGKIFIVGSTAPALFDIKAVPHDRSYPAVEIHASLMNSFLTNTFVHRLAPWQDFLILLLIGIIIGFVSYLFKPLAGALLTVASIFVYFLLAMTLFGADHLWIEIARPILVILLTFTAVMAYRYITEEKDRKFLQSTFKQYLSPELIDIMYKSRQQPLLGGEEGIRTAYFTDIQSFSTFSEKLGSPTRLVELLNEYLSQMTDILLKHYGTLDKYEGDAIIAFFGAPMPMEDHAYQACLTAIDMQETLGTLRKKWVAEGDKWPEIVHQMRMRIGINTGLITTGNMGSNIRKNYTMMGDAVNLAARLESAAKQYGVYTMISHNTCELVRNDFLVRQIDKITVVGKSEPVVVYELMARKADDDGRFSPLLDLYQEGMNYFYAREWDAAITKLEAAHEKEPFRTIAPKGMTPSKKILEYCEMYRENPPDADWDGVMRLSSK